MKSHTWQWGLSLLGIIMIIGTFETNTLGDELSSSPSIPVETVADYVHSIIEADRTIYSSHVVNRMTQQGIVTANEHWEQQHALPLPAQFLQAAGKLVAKKAHGVRYRLISLWPIYERNGPATPFERHGLEAVEKNPDKPHAGIVNSGKMKFYQAIYADTAVAEACVTCHNQHPLSPKRDFKIGDVMGGIVITIPLD